MLTGGGGVVGQVGLGAFSERRGFSAGYVVGGLLTLGALPLLASIRSRKDSADYFEGTHESPTGACAPRGIPQIAQLPAELVETG
jgi:hypothetical protein